jgi:hypothetical protein
MRYAFPPYVLWFSVFAFQQKGVAGASPAQKKDW